jgi:hypothetical protein
VNTIHALILLPIPVKEVLDSKNFSRSSATFSFFARN